MQLRSGYRFRGGSIDALTYANELTLMSETPEGLQAVFYTAGRVATWAGLKFNPRIEFTAVVVKSYKHIQHNSVRTICD